MTRSFALCTVCLWLYATSALASDADEAARRHFESGKEYFERAEYDDAVREFEQAYRLSGRVPLLVNISKAQEAAGRPSEAADALERFRSVAPADDPLRPEVELRIQRLRMQAARQSVQASSPAPGSAAGAEAPRPSEPTTAETQSQLAPWLVIGAGALTTATGSVFVLLGRSDISKVEDPGDDTRWKDVEEEADRGPTRVRLGIGLAGAGAAIAAAGITWLILRKKSAHPNETQVGLSPVALHVQGRF